MTHSSPSFDPILIAFSVILLVWLVADFLQLRSFHKRMDKDFNLLADYIQLKFEYSKACNYIAQYKTLLNQHNTPLAQIIEAEMARLFPDTDEKERFYNDH